MSSGEGAEETTKDAGDIAALFKPGKPEKWLNWVGLGSGESCPPDEVTLLPSLMGVCGAQLVKDREWFNREMFYCCSQIV